LDMAGAILSFPWHSSLVTPTTSFPAIFCFPPKRKEAPLRRRHLGVEMNRRQKTKS
jgi:hypothetical protein